MSLEQEPELDNVGEAGDVLALLVQAVDRANQGLVVCDSEGRVVLRNAPARDLLNARDGDFLAEKAIEAALGRALGGSFHEETLDLYSPTRHTLEIRAYPIGDTNPPAGAVALVDDVSELRRLEAVRRDFVANLSHELKTPLGALSLLAETLDDEEDPEVVARLTARVGSGSHPLRPDRGRPARLVSYRGGWRRQAEPRHLFGHHQ